MTEYILNPAHKELECKKEISNDSYAYITERKRIQERLLLPRISLLSLS